MSLEEAGHYPVEKFLIAFALILVSAKIFGALAERIKQPAVLGELVAGVILGGSVLALIPSSDGMAGFQTFHLLAEIGVVILLFEIGLETNLADMVKVGPASAMVAIVGVAVPFVLGFAGVLAFEKYGLIQGVDPSMMTLIAITAGATLTATSVGITARVLSDMNKLGTPEAKIILGAAVIDDVLGLIILGVVSGLIEAARSGGAGITAAGVLIITLKAFGFLLAAIVVGNIIASRFFNLINKMRVRGALLLFALSFALVFAYLASLVGLAPIVGAFAAGLVLARTNQVNIIEERLKPVADVFTPIFFIMVGAAVDIRVFNPFVRENIPILMIAGVLFIIAVVGKFVSGWAVFQKGINKFVIGFGMIPRGEVGLIFAQVGLAYGVFSSQLFSAMTVMVMLTTFVAPPLLKIAFARNGGQASEGGYV